MGVATETANVRCWFFDLVMVAFWSEGSAFRASVKGVGFQSGVQVWFYLLGAFAKAKGKAAFLSVSGIRAFLNETGTVFDLIRSWVVLFLARLSLGGFFE